MHAVDAFQIAAVTVLKDEKLRKIREQFQIRDLRPSVAVRAEF
jgi:hypothetical protein